MADAFTIDYTDITDAVRTIERDLGVDVSAAVRTLGLELYADVTELSPVDTGRYRASWQLNQTTPNLATAQEGQFSDQPPTGNSLPPPTLNIRPGYHVVVLSNALPYAQRIEDGWSTEKAPDGVLKRALARRGGDV